MDIKCSPQCYCCYVICTSPATRKKYIIKAFIRHEDVLLALAYSSWQRSCSQGKSHKSLWRRPSCHIQCTRSHDHQHSGGGDKTEQNMCQIYSQYMMLTLTTIIKSLDNLQSVLNCFCHLPPLPPLPLSAVLVLDIHQAVVRLDSFGCTGRIRGHFFLFCEVHYIDQDYIVQR